MKSDIVIIGGGLIGLYTAYALLKHTTQITIIDKNEFGQESSWAAGGILSPLLPWHYNDAVNQLTINAQQTYLQEHQRLLDSTGIDIEFWQCGLNVLDQAEKTSAHSWAQNYQLDITETNTSLCLSTVSQIRTPRLIKALINYLQQSNIQLLPHTEVYNINLKNEKVINVETSIGKILTNDVICCAGAWSERLINNLNTQLVSRLYPIKGQIISFDGRGIKLDTILYSDRHYLIPRRDGLILAGSTVEETGFQDVITREARDHLKNKSYDLLPALRGHNVLHHWSGLRPGSENNVPIIGPHPTIEGLHLNCGHHRYGVAMAPSAADIVTQWIVNAESTDKESRYLLAI